jgi:hypothetical protein
MDAARLYVGWMKIAAGLVLTTMGCSTTSTISRIHEGEVEGDIVGGSADSIFVARAGGGECEIKRDDISLIDYPGNVHRNAGLAVLVYGGSTSPWDCPNARSARRTRPRFVPACSFRQRSDSV